VYSLPTSTYVTSSEMMVLALGLSSHSDISRLDIEAACDELDTESLAAGLLLDSRPVNIT